MHEYMKRLDKAIKKGVIDKGCVATANILHDSWCMTYKSGYCNCDPDIQIVSGNRVFVVTKDGSLEEKYVKH